MKKYLYGASVQGIQSFIFQTNKLKEIAGASELVEQICTGQFAKILGISQEKLDDDKNAIVTAAGNIKYLFEKDDLCKKVVKNFPKQIVEFAPGITISQAVVEVEGPLTENHINELEKRLRAQRNKASRPHDIGLIAVNRSRQTGLPANEFSKIYGNKISIDYGTKAKLDNGNKSNRVIKSFLGEVEKSKIPLEMENITKSKNPQYSWLAVIHADGNNLGLTLQRLAKELRGSNKVEYEEGVRSFSLALDEATKNAAKAAYIDAIKNSGIKSSDKLPFRPIVIGGDDLTIICRADLALDFTKHFLLNFTEETKNQFGNLNIESIKNGLTACAGIAYIKESYPFHYGYHLAETLCTYAKKKSKSMVESDELTPSSLMFHKVQDSFIEDFNQIRERELKAKAADIRFDYGPYFLKNLNGCPKIDDLMKNVEMLNGQEGNAVKTHLRQWLTDMHENHELAKQKLDRLISVASPATLKITKALGLPEIADKEGKSPVYDWLTIHSINYGGN